MRSMIDQRRAERETGVERQDLLSRLLYANDTEEKESKRLSTEELIGDLLLVPSLSFCRSRSHADLAIVFIWSKSIHVCWSASPAGPRWCSY